MIFRFLLLFCFVSGSITAQVVNSPEKQNQSNSVEPSIEQSKKELELKEVEPAYSGAPESKKAKAADASVSDKSASQKLIIQQNQSLFTSYKTQSSAMNSQRSPTVEQQKKMDEAVKNLEISAPESFEYNYFKYVAGNHNTSYIKHLQKAEKLKPNNQDVHTQLAAYYLITEEKINSKKYLIKLAQSGKISKESIDYGQDLLRSVPENGTLITHGFDDSYSAYYLQTVDGFRKDVQIISLDHLQSESLRTNLKQKGYKLPNKDIIDVSYLSEFCKLNEGKKIGISLTTPKEYFKGISDKLFVVGLIFEYHSNEFNNFHRNELLWERELLKLTIENANTDKAKTLSSNYLPMLFYLRTVYQTQNDVAKIRKIEETMDKIAVQSNKYDKVQKLKNAY